MDKTKERKIIERGDGFDIIAFGGKKYKRINGENCEDCCFSRGEHCVKPNDLTELPFIDEEKLGQDEGACREYYYKKVKEEK